MIAGGPEWQPYQACGRLQLLYLAPPSHFVVWLHAASQWTYEALRWLAIHFWRWLHPSLTPIAFMVFIFAIVILYHVWRELQRQAVIIEPFDIPKSFCDLGLTSRALASRIGAVFEELETSIQSGSMKRDALGYTHLEMRPDIEIPQTKMGLRAMIEFLRGIFGWHVLRISGDVVEPPASSPSQLTVTVYGTWGRSQNRVGQARVPLGEFDALVRQAAELMLEFANPYLFGLLLLSRHDGEGAARVANKMTSNEKSMAALMGKRMALQRRTYGHLLSAIVLNDRKNHEAAVEQCKKALALNRRFAPAYNNWGGALYAQKLNAEAIAKYEMAVEFDPRYAAAYVNWAIALSSQELYAEAFLKYERAIEVDPTYLSAYDSWEGTLNRMESSASSDAGSRTCVAGFREKFAKINADRPGR